MGYERRSRSFNFMGFVPIGKTIEVVPEREETPVVIFWPPKNRRIEGGTVALPLSEFNRGVRANPARCHVRMG